MPPIFKTFCTNFRTFSSEIIQLHVTDYPDLQHRLQNIHLQESSLFNVLNTRTSSVSTAPPVLGCLNGIQFLSSHCKMAQQAQPVEDVAVTDSSRVQTEHKYHFTIPLSGPWRCRPFQQLFVSLWKWRLWTFVKSIQNIGKRCLMQCDWDHLFNLAIKNVKIKIRSMLLGGWMLPQAQN